MLHLDRAARFFCPHGGTWNADALPANFSAEERWRPRGECTYDSRD